MKKVTALLGLNEDANENSIVTAIEAERKKVIAMLGERDTAVTNLGLATTRVTALETENATLKAEKTISDAAKKTAEDAVESAAIVTAYNGGVATGRIKEDDKGVVKASLVKLATTIGSVEFKKYVDALPVSKVSAKIIIGDGGSATGLLNVVSTAMANKRKELAGQ